MKEDIEEKNKLFDALAEISKAMEEHVVEYNEQVIEYWDSLTMEQKEKSFYYVCSKIYENDVVLRGSYRFGLYEIFGFDPSMYMAGIDCGYLELHNLIGDGVDIKNMRLAKAITIKTEENTQEITLPDGCYISYDEDSNKITIEKK